MVELLTGLLPDPSRCLTRGEMRSLLQSDVNLVHIGCGRNDKYGRVLARVSREPAGRHAGEVLLEEGLAYAYSGGTKQYF